MKKTVFSLLLMALGWFCLVNVALSVAGKAPFIVIPEKFATLVVVIASLWAFHLASGTLAVLGRAGLILSALPIFAVGGLVGFASAGYVGAGIGFFVPLLVTLKFGFVGLAGMAVVAVGAGMAFLR